MTRNKSVTILCDNCETEIDPDEIKEKLRNEDIYDIDASSRELLRDSRYDLCIECAEEYPEWFYKVHFGNLHSEVRNVSRREIPSPEEVKKWVWAIFTGEDAPCGLFKSVEAAEEWVEKLAPEISREEYFDDIYANGEPQNYYIDRTIELKQKQEQ